MEDRGKRLLVLAVVAPAVLGMILWQGRHHADGGFNLVFLPLLVILAVAALLFFRKSPAPRPHKANPIAGLAAGIIALVAIWWDRLRRPGAPMDGQSDVYAPLVVAGIILALLIWRLLKRDREQKPR